MKRIVHLILCGMLIISTNMLYAGGSHEPKSTTVDIKVPAWIVNHPEDTAGQTWFVALGNDPAGNESSAQDAATLDLIGQINRYLGVNISTQSTATEQASADAYQASVFGVVRQSSSGEVAGLRVADRWVSQDSQGVTVYLLGEYRTADLEREKAKRQALAAETEAAVSLPEGQGRSAEANGELWAASQFYLQAARAALDPQIRNSAIKLQRNLLNAQRVIGGIELVKLSGPASVITGQPTDQDFVVLARRTSNGQAISGLDLVAGFREYQANGKFNQVRRLLKTDSQGLARINLPMGSAPGNQQVVFNLNLADAMMPLAGVDGDSRDLVTGLANLLSGKKLVVDFMVRAAGWKLPLAVMILENDENGRGVPGNTVLLATQERLGAAGYRLVALQPALTQEEAASAALAAKAERLAWGQAAVISVDDRGTDGVFVKVSATVSVTELSAATLLRTVSKLVNGRGSNLAQAKRDAFTRLGQEIGDQLARDLP